MQVRGENLAKHFWDFRFSIWEERISQKETKGTKEEWVVARLGAGRRNDKPGTGKGRVHSGF
jgi:hypothetical protein